jgi:superkiller protein 8
LHIHSTIDPAFPRVQAIEGAHKLGIHHVCTAKGGPGLVAASAGFGGEIKLWRRRDQNLSGDWEPWFEIEAAKSAGGDVWAIALSTDEQYLACTTHDGTVRVWDLATRAVIQTYETVGSFGTAVDLSRDGRLTASGHQNGGVFVQQ